MIRAGTTAKGDVLGVARLAGIMAAKRTADLIPLCHPLPIASVRGRAARDGRRRRDDRGHGRNHRPHWGGNGGADRGFASRR